MTTEEKFNAAVNVIRSLPKNGECGLFVMNLDFFCNTRFASLIYSPNYAITARETVVMKFCNMYSDCKH